MRRLPASLPLPLLLALGLGTLAAACPSSPGGGTPDQAQQAEPGAPGDEVAIPPPARDGEGVSLLWLGQACFRIVSAGGTRVVIDPFDPGRLGFPRPTGLEAHAVLITHQHFDHNHAEIVGGSPRVLAGVVEEGGAGRFVAIDERLSDDVRVRSVSAFHDERRGAARGPDAIFVIEASGVRIVHMGDIGQSRLDDEQVAAIAGDGGAGSPGVDVLLVPVGGNFTVDAAGARSLIEQLRPKVVVPMHYLIERNRPHVPIAPVDAFLEDASDVTRQADLEVRVTRADLDRGASTRIWVLRAAALAGASGATEGEGN